jgi:hypothetical protein
MISVKRIILITQIGKRDRLSLYTDLPPAEYPWNENPSVDLFCARGCGLEYVARVFPDAMLQIFDLDKKLNIK